MVDLTVNGVLIPFNPCSGTPRDAQRNVEATLERVPPQHLRRITRIDVYRPPVPETGDPYAGGGSGLGFPRLSVFCFDVRYRPNNRPINLTLLHEIGHILDHSYGCAEALMARNPELWRDLVGLTPLAATRHTRGTGEHYADGYQRFINGRNVPPTLRAVMMASPAFDGMGAFTPLPR